LSSVELSAEDALRLNVLLAGEVHAVRIDEGARTLYALTPKAEARIVLNPVGRAERYFQRVREVLGGHVLGSPGGYPVYLRRWTRMGQAGEKNLEALLKLGEPEAVLAAGLLAPEERLQLWAKAKRRPHFLIGFLESLPDELPPEPERALPAGLPDTPAARLLARCYSGPGQSYLKTAELALDKAPTHEAVYLLLDLIGQYFAAGDEAAALPLPASEVAALEALSRLSHEAALPILTRTTAVGPLMRRHLEPLFGPIIGHLKALRGMT
jgi:hypothetical protein